jgi:hypothetical protein
MSWKNRALHMLHFLPFVLAVLILVPQSVADARDLNNIRLQAKMYDASGQLYKVYMFSDDETSATTQSVTAFANPGDVVYTGHYQFAIGTNEEKYVHIQPFNINVFANDTLKFNSNKVMNYVIASGRKQQPDILVVSQYGDSGHYAVAAYYIRDGAMRKLDWVEQDGRILNSVINSKNQKVWSNGFREYSTKRWVRPGEGQVGYHETRWLLDIATDALRFSAENPKDYVSPWDIQTPAMPTLAVGRQSSINGAIAYLGNCTNVKYDWNDAWCGAHAWFDYGEAWIEYAKDTNTEGAVSRVIITKPNFVTQRGIQVGDDEKRVVLLYGQPDSIHQNGYVYFVKRNGVKDGVRRIVFHIDDNKVDYIAYSQTPGGI